MRFAYGQTSKNGHFVRKFEWTGWAALYLKKSSTFSNLDAKRSTVDLDDVWGNDKSVRVDIVDSA